MDVNTLSKYYYAYLGSLITILSGGFATAECCLSQLRHCVIYQDSKQKIGLNSDESFSSRKFDTTERQLVREPCMVSKGIQKLGHNQMWCCKPHWKALANETGDNRNWLAAAEDASLVAVVAAVLSKRETNLTLFWVGSISVVLD